MANNYTKATINTTIPKEDITDLELNLLEMSNINFEYHSSEDTPDAGFYYFYSEECMIDTLGENGDDRYLEFSEDDAIDNRNKPYFKEGEVKPGISYHDIFQNIVSRSNTLTYVEIEGAFICDKMRPGEFGGFAELITEKNIYSSGTSTLMREFHQAASSFAEEALEEEGGLRP